ncbi:peptidylprolyl isomerase [Paenibacillus sp. NPDC056579]|uniref:peptidylprolyl isomerase n=1 Tax=Paenibacillus sp. NPDC056579 TaxID=3345871 RepID=UPI0036A21052
MNDKVKGLLLGLSLGTLLTGTVAYASGTQIEVYFQNIKYMFDGFEKKPAEDQGQGFIYNGTTYVPLRFVSEALGKEVQWDGDTQTAWIGRKIDRSAVIATYPGGQVTRGDYETYLAIIQMADPQQKSAEQTDAYKQSVINRIAGSQILLDKLSEEAKAAIPSAVDAQMKGAANFLQSNAEEMSKHGVTEEDIRLYVRDGVILDKWLQSFTDEAGLRAAYDKMVAANDESVVKASVRHILIMNTDKDKKPRTKEAVAQIVKEVQDKLRNGEDFAVLAKQYSEDMGSKDNGGLYKDEPITRWVEAFKKAAHTLALNTASDPIETEYGTHIMRVEARDFIPYAQFNDTQLAETIMDSHYQQFMNSELPSLLQIVEIPK